MNVSSQSPLNKACIEKKKIELQGKMQLYGSRTDWVELEKQSA